MMYLDANIRPNYTFFKYCDECKVKIEFMHNLKEALPRCGKQCGSI